MKLVSTIIKKDTKSHTSYRAKKVIEAANEDEAGLSFDRIMFFLVMSN